MSSGSAATSSPESCAAWRAAATAYCEKRSMRRAARFSMKSSGSKSLTSPAMRDVRREASNFVTAPMPLSPASKRFQTVATSLPNGQMMPDPVMTTRRGPSSMPVFSAIAPVSVNRSRASPTITLSAGASYYCSLSVARARKPAGRWVAEQPEVAAAAYVHHDR